MRSVVGAAIVLVSIASGACGVVGGSDPTPTPTTETHTLTGVFTLGDRAGSFEVGQPCSGTGWRVGVRGEKRVFVYDRWDGDRKVLATSTLDQGVGAANPDYDFAVCSFNFQVTGIPRAEYYVVAVEFAESPGYTYDAMQENNWTVKFGAFSE